MDVRSKATWEMSDKIQFGKNGLWTAVYRIPLICDWILATRANFFSLMLVLVLSVTAAHAAERQTLHGHVPAAVGDFHLQPVGRLPAQERLSLVIGLPLRNREEFNNLLQQIYDPSSPQYRRYLTPQQIAERFGPTEQDYQAVVTFSQANGLEVSGTHADRTLLRVDGTVADIEKAFHVTMLVYTHPTEARTFYAPNVEPSLDLAVPILHISSLNNYILPRPSGHIGTPRKQGADATPAAGSGPGGAYWGNDFRAAYVPGTSLIGAGQAVGLLELDGYYTNDIRTYETNANLPNVTLTNVLIDGFSGTPDTDANRVGEVSLDIEMVVSMASGLSKVIVYEAPNCCYYWVDILKQMQEDNIAKQLSSSWLFDYDDPNADTVYQEYAVQGQSFFQCSGDYLAFYNGVTQWTDDPNVTLVGGTMLTTTGPGGSWVSETTWNNGNGTNGSGGGSSTSYMGNFSIPSWQQGINMTTNHGSTSRRNVPDVSLVAYNAWVVWNNGSKDWWWGTSIAAPLWAGFTALVNQQAAIYGEPMVGFLNPALYAIGTGSLYSTCFHDITTGNNTNSHSSGLYYATAGYDLCTGWGTPTGTNLINVLTSSPFIYRTLRNSDGSVTLSFVCPPSSTNVVLSATNLSPPVIWQPLSTNIAGADGNWQFTDTNAASYQTRFYRSLTR
jgi:subtilase family serine protease